MLFPPTPPALTAFYAALLALIYVGLSVWVVAGRLSTDTLHGDGNDDALLKRIRSHGNFAEYVPFALIVIGLLETAGAAKLFVHVLLILLVIARILHPIGMFAPKNSIQQFGCRGVGAVGTLGIIAVAAIALLVRTI